MLTALATAVDAAAPRPAAAADGERPGSELQAHKADVLVFAEGDHADEVIKPQDLNSGGPPVRAWPFAILPISTPDKARKWCLDRRRGASQHFRWRQLTVRSLSLVRSLERQEHSKEGDGSQYQMPHN